MFCLVFCCHRKSNQPCSSGDLPAGSSPVISSGTQRPWSSRVSTDRHRQSTRQPLEGTTHRKRPSEAAENSIILWNSSGVLCSLTSQSRFSISQYIHIYQSICFQFKPVVSGKLGNIYIVLLNVSHRQLVNYCASLQHMQLWLPLHIFLINADSAAYAVE